MTTELLVALAQSFSDDLTSGDDKAAASGEELLDALSAWLQNKKDASRVVTQDRIRELLSDDVGRTAAEIAKELYLGRRVANSVLYSGASLFEKSTDPRPFWSLRSS